MRANEPRDQVMKDGKTGMLNLPGTPCTLFGLDTIYLDCLRFDGLCELSDILVQRASGSLIPGGAPDSNLV